MIIKVSIYENRILIDQLDEEAESIDSIVKEAMKTNKKYKPYTFERYTGETWVMFKRYNIPHRIEFQEVV